MAGVGDELLLTPQHFLGGSGHEPGKVETDAQQQEQSAQQEEDPLEHPPDVRGLHGGVLEDDIAGPVFVADAVIQVILPLVCVIILSADAPDYFRDVGLLILPVAGLDAPDSSV